MRGVQKGIWFVFRFTQETVEQRRECLGETEEGRVRIVRTKESYVKEGSVRVEHSSQLGISEDTLPTRTPPQPERRSLEFTYPQIPSSTLLITTRSKPSELNIVANPARGVLCQYTRRLGYVCRD